MKKRITPATTVRIKLKKIDKLSRLFGLVASTPLSLYLVLFHSLLRLTSFLSQNENKRLSWSQIDRTSGVVNNKKEKKKARYTQSVIEHMAFDSPCHSSVCDSLPALPTAERIHQITFRQFPYPGNQHQGFLVNQMHAHDLATRGQSFISLSLPNVCHSSGTISPLFTCSLLWNSLPSSLRHPDVDFSRFRNALQKCHLHGIPCN